MLCQSALQVGIGSLLAAVEWTELASDIGSSSVSVLVAMLVTDSGLGTDVAAVVAAPSPAVETQEFVQSVHDCFVGSAGDLSQPLA